MRHSRMIVIVLAMVFVATCSARTKFRKTWKNPQAGPIHFNRILAVAIMPNETLRCAAEDQMVQNT